MRYTHELLLKLRRIADRGFCDLLVSFNPLDVGWLFSTETLAAVRLRGFKV